MNNPIQMSDVQRPIRRQRSIYQVHYGLPRQEAMAQWPALHTLHVQAYGSQVAGHRGEVQDKYLGLLQCSNGTLLKPLLKPNQTREVDFYNRLQLTDDQDLVELRDFVPKYFGCTKFTYNGYEHEYIILEDLANHMMEPCIMDVKIGKRTWDPLATESKIANEQAKYAQCRQEYAFCIPGFQVYKLTSGKLIKYGKDYGKKLHGQMVKDSIKNFLNGMGTSLCRALILQFISELWRIQKWISKQRKVKIYSASLLLIYDAKRLRDCCGEHDLLVSKPRCVPPITATRRKSIHSMHSLHNGSNFSGQIDNQGPVYRKVNSVPIAPMQLAQQSFGNFAPITSKWSEALEHSNKTHSFDNNYESKINKMKMNYYSMLDQLSSDGATNKPWGTVKIIDFAHAFFNEAEDESLDENFREGIQHFVEIFEELLKETDDQVF